MSALPLSHRFELSFIPDQNCFCATNKEKTSDPLPAALQKSPKFCLHRGENHGKHSMQIAYSPSLMIFFSQIEGPCVYVLADLHLERLSWRSWEPREWNKKQWDQTVPGLFIATLCSVDLHMTQTQSCWEGLIRKLIKEASSMFSTWLFPLNPHKCCSVIRSSSPLPQPFVGSLLCSKLAWRAPPHLETHYGSDCFNCVAEV